MRCLVTGGAGFIGSHLVERLKQLGHETLTVDDWSNAAIERPHVNTAQYDISTLPTWPGFYPQWIFHLAAISRTGIAIDNPMRCHEVNVTGSLRVLNLAARHGVNPKPRVVLASSNIVYGSPNPYRASKLAMEEYMMAYNELYGLNACALRYSNVYGPRMRWDDPICLASVRRSKYEKGYVELTGDGKQSRDWTHVSDIVEGTILAAQSDYKGVMDLTSGEHRSMQEMACYFECSIRYIPDRPGDTKHIVQSPEMASKVLKWHAKIATAIGIQDVLKEVPAEVQHA